MSLRSCWFPARWNNNFKHRREGQHCSPSCLALIMEDYLSRMDGPPPPYNNHIRGRFPKMVVGFPNCHGFPTKNDHDLGCEMVVPPFKETPIYSSLGLINPACSLRFAVSCIYCWPRHIHCLRYFAQRRVATRRSPWNDKENPCWAASTWDLLQQNPGSNWKMDMMTRSQIPSTILLYNLGCCIGHT